MKKLFCCLLTAIGIIQLSEAQTRYVIQFTDKGSNPYSFSNPLAYLSQHSLDRRTRYSIALDSTDLPVTPRYIDSVRLAGAVTILNVSKWLNAISIQTEDAAALSKINSLPFVKSSARVGLRTSGRADNKSDASERPVSLRANGTSDFFNYGLSVEQLRIHNGQFLHNIGLRGQNMIIGMLDGGFFNYTNLRAFDSARLNGQILGTWDFVAREESVKEDHPHGMQCFSVIAANIPGQFVGSAPKANFYLFRSEEVASEYRIEEHNWVCAAERLDSAGGDVISSSLGYGDQMSDPSQDHTYQEMNGNITMAAIGADLAAKKGILVVNAAGNEGTDPWHYISTPADADSVLAVAAVDIAGTVAGFSSYGPSSDGQVKPDVASVGVNTVIQTTSNTVGVGSGTSFACPNMAGLTTCLWQGFPEVNNMKIIQALRQASNKANNPDNRVGYGIPDVKKALVNLLKEFSTASASITNCKTTINWNSKDMNAMKYEIERMLPGQNGFVKIAEQPGTGSVFTTHMNIQFEDVLSNVQQGAISYRIRQIVDTASASLTAYYIDTVTANNTNACKAVDPAVIVPNPVPGRFALKVTTTEAIPDLIIRIMNAKGQEVYRSKQSKASGTTSIDIPFPFASGKYYVLIYNSSKLIVTRELIKL